MKFLLIRVLDFTKTSKTVKWHCLDINSPYVQSSWTHSFQSITIHFLQAFLSSLIMQFFQHRLQSSSYCTLGNAAASPLFHLQYLLLNVIFNFLLLLLSLDLLLRFLSISIFNCFLFWHVCQHCTPEAISPSISLPVLIGALGKTRTISGLNDIESIQGIFNANSLFSYMYERLKVQWLLSYRLWWITDYVK